MTDAVDQATDADELRLELLRRRLAERGLAASTPAQPQSGPDHESQPLTMSDGQRRMWFVQALDPDGALANISVSYRLTGPLDGTRLQAALAAVAARHPVLRTVYPVDEAGEPNPVIAEVTPGFATHDLSDLAEQARALRLEVLAQREFATPFRLESDAPLRLTLVRIAPDEYILLLVAHHIAWDDDSWAVFFADLTAAYADPEQFATRAPVPHPVPATGLGHEAELDYWRTLLADPPDPLELPGPHGSAIPSTLRAGLCTRALPAELMSDIAELARSNGATPYMVIAAALSALIHRYTATDDFLIASPVLNRTAGTEGAIGYFGNTVVLRAKVDAATRFSDLLARTRDAALGAFGHQGINLDRVVRELNPDRRHGGVERLTRLSFGFRSTQGGGFQPDGIACTRADYRGKVAQLPLGIMVEADADGALIEAEYLHDVLDGPLVEQLLRHLVQLLSAAVAQPETTVGELDMLGDDDRAWLDAISRGPDFIPPPEAPATLGALVAARAAATPNAIAVVDDHGRYSYAEINARANRVAHHLIAAGIGTEDKVAVLFGRCTELVVTALGIAKAGAAYVPIDPEYPPDRIEFILGDARPSIVLREPLTADELAGRPDTDPTDADRVRPLRPENLAYLIYTSGSTGLPKGVEVSHAPITEYLLWFGAEYGVDDTDVLLQVASPSFDVSIGELFGTLGSGARLVIPRPDGLRDIGYLTDLLQREGVTAMHFVPSLLGLFLSLPGVNQWRTLRRIPIGGEPLPGELADKFHATFDAMLHNFYGPTETVVNSSRHKVEGPQGNRIVPIGSPNINTTIWLLDDALQPVPVGVIGEIYIGGSHMARGYFDRPGLTAERFVADPWTPGQRLYRTGDLARRNAAGDLEFIGRADDQVKVRGFRIELGEVASAISVDPSVGQCVVVVSDLPGLGRSLVAYLTPGAGAAEDTVEVARIRARVAAALPEYMAPAAYVVVDDIPITAHGKIDRAALPDPQPIESTPYREPETDTEHVVAQLFAQLLSRDKVGADDSFFDLGGHSLLATKLVAAIRARCEVEIGIREIFEAGTVSRLAAAIDRAPAAQPGETGAGRPELVAVPRSGDLPVSASQLRTWFAYRLDPNATGDNIPLTARLTGPCDTAALTAAIGDVVARHDSLRTTFREIDGVPHQVINAPAAVPVAELQCPEADPDAVAAWTQARLGEQRGVAFDLERDWPIRAALLHLPGDERVLSLVVHHIAADHWSVEVLFTDLLIAYRSRATGSAPAWEPPALQYADFAHWQGELLRDESGLIEAQRRYWVEQLTGLADDTGPRPDFPRPATANGSGDSVAFTVPPQVRAGLAALARETGATEFMVVQSAVAVLLHLAGSGDDIPLGVPIAGRTDSALDNLVGFFVNIVVLRNRLAGNPTLREVVSRAREVALGAYAHADLPFDRLVEALNPVRTLSRNPLFQVVVHVREAADVTHVIDSGPDGDLVFRTVMPTFDIAHADLSVNLFATADADGAGYDGHLIYRTDLYERATVQRLADWLGRVLAAMAGDPGQTLRDISLVDDDQRRRILQQWSCGAKIPAGDPKSIADVLAPSRSFEGVAVRCAGAELTYPQLHSRSDRLAELLIDAGVQPGTLVGLSVRRDLDLPVALVGIMKAGAGYFPLDPSYPRQRLEFMIDDVLSDTAFAPGAARVILVSTATREAIPAPDGVTLLCLDDADVQAELTNDVAGLNLPVPHPDDPMFLVFTSGSTGVPKGVVGTHRSMSARLNWQIAHYPVTGADIRLAQSSMTFLEGGMEMLAGLAAGATLILADDNEFRNPEALARLIVDERVAQVTAVASLISVLAESGGSARLDGGEPKLGPPHGSGGSARLDEGEPKLGPPHEPDITLRGLRRLVCSGEPVSADLLARLGDALDPNAQLLNNFGATETSGAVVRGELEPPTPKLGRPTPGAQAYLLDDALQPVPPGVVGEVYYAGPQVVRGYWKRPGLTSTRFVANPFSDTPGDRLYRSGDRARWTVDGVLEFVGRTDHQVKVRGFRVELAEVEAALRGAPGVATAAARTWEQRGVTTLAGYLVPGGPVSDAAEFIASVRAAVAATLPGYMVPSSLTVLDAMPLTDSGKLNRPALPQPAVATRGESDPPVTATEQTLVGICAELLGVAAIGRSDGFFELGGDSILSVQLAARARAAGLDVDPRMIFEHPTFAELAAAVDLQAAAGGTVESADTAFEPMSVSGLSNDALANLTAAWGDSP